MNNILGRVKDVISENELLTEQAKMGAARSDSSDSGSNDLDMKLLHPKSKLSGPNIVFESRISELEAQLAQAEIEIKNLSQENRLQKHTMSDDSVIDGMYKRQIEMLQK